MRNTTQKYSLKKNNNNKTKPNKAKHPQITKNPNATCTP